jgi:tRNA-dihydrouridine synthase
MLAKLEIKGVCFEPPIFCAPMAGITHSAFRRLLADFGGYGAVFTELLAGSQIASENPDISTYLKSRRQDGKVIYQLLLTQHSRIPECIAKIAALEPAGIDINCGCGGQNVRRAGGGIALFEDMGKLKHVLRNVRREHKGLLTLKTRLGYEAPDWRDKFLERLKLIEDCGVDAITVHPRFAKQHLKRHAMREVFGWIAANTSMPVIANGDILGPSTLAADPGPFLCASGIMVGRAAAVQPWIFAAWENPDFKVDHLEVWTRFYNYVLEDFRPERALEPLKLFARYYAQNFLFHHAFYASLYSEDRIEAVHEKAVRFLSSSPALRSSITTQGV